MTEKKNVYQRLHAAMGEVDYIQKERKQGMQYTIVSHDAVTGKVRPILHKHGIVYHPHSLEYVQDGNRTQVSLTVRFVNVDEPTDFVDVPCLGFGIDSQDKGPGKAVSYAVKYALLKALGLETGDDPDEDADTPRHEPARAEPTAEQKAAAAKKAADGLKKAVAEAKSGDDLFKVKSEPDNATKIQRLKEGYPALWEDVMSEIAKRETELMRDAA